MRLYTEEELKMIGNDVDEFYEEDIDLDDIPEVKVSRFEKIKNWFNSRKTEKLQLEDDIPVVKVGKIEKIKSWSSTKKEERLLKREQQLLKKEEKLSVKRENLFTKHDEKIEKKQEKIEKRKLRKQERELKRQEKKLKKEEKRALKNNGIYTKMDLVKSYLKVGVLGGLSSICLASAIISAVSVFSIGFIPALACTTGFVVASKIFNYFYKEEIETNNIIVNSYIENKKEVVEEEKENKVGLFKSLKNRFSKSKEKDTITEEQENETINVKDLIINTNNISNVKLTREEKVAKVNKECQLVRNRVNNLTTYYVFVPKEDIKLQKFIRSEYKKQYPEDEIQSFVRDDKKVLVLSNRPIIK